MPDTVIALRADRIAKACSDGVRMPSELVKDAIIALPLGRDGQLIDRIKKALALNSRALWRRHEPWNLASAHPDGYFMYLDQHFNGWTSHAMGFNLGMDQDLLTAQLRACMLIPKTARKAGKLRTWGDIESIQRKFGDKKMELKDLTVGQMILVYNKLAEAQSLAPVTRFGSRDVALKRVQEVLDKAPEGSEAAFEQVIGAIPADAMKHRTVRTPRDPNAPKPVRASSVDRNEIGTRVTTKKHIAWSLLSDRGRVTQTELREAIYGAGAGNGQDQKAKALNSALGQVMMGLSTTAKDKGYAITKGKDENDVYWSLEKLPTTEQAQSEAVPQEGA